ncbi:hypothetical protein, partial [Actinomadura latina]|uniref:hypothetical protein n=1 Tax=Actinomadura latina TaxID=163603 RepID=UPI0008321427
YVEGLVAQYPSVVDYYLHGGRDRIQDAYQALAAMFALPGGGPGGGVDHQLNAAQLVERIQGALPVLDGDPHYRYELRFGEDQFPPVPSRPNLVMSWIAGDKRTGRWAAVDVIARCAAAVQERPITISGSFTVAPGSGFGETLRDFFGYGTPFTSPQGAYQGQVTAPGGVGGPVKNATVTIAPVAGGDLGEDSGLHLEVIDAGGNTVAEVDLDRIDRSQGSDGARVVLREEHGTFIFEDRYNLSGGSGTRSVRLGDFTGQPVDPVLGALRFLQACRPGNTGRVSRRNTPPELGLSDPNLGFSWPVQWQQELAGLVELLDALSVIQRHTSRRIVVPDLNSLTPDQANNWRLAAKILQGKEVTLTYPSEQCLILDLNADLDAEIVLGQTLLLAVPLIVAVAGHELDLGPVEMRLSSSTLVARGSHPQQPGRTRYVFTTPDRRFQLRRPGDQQATQQSAEPGEHSDPRGQSQPN